MARLTPRRQSSVNTFSNTEGAGFPWHRPKQACVLAWGVRVLTHCSEEREAFQGWAPGTCAHPPPPVRSQTRENPQSRAQIPSENDSGCIRAMWVMEPLKPYSIEHGCGRFSLEKINQLLPNSRRSHLKKINKYLRSTIRPCSLNPCHTFDSWGRGDFKTKATKAHQNNYQILWG